MDRLEKAVTSLLETQIAMQNQMVALQAVTQNQMAAFQTQMAKLAERQVDIDKLWFEIREELNQVINILHEHTVLLRNLPEAIKEKIGFKA